MFYLSAEKINIAIIVLNLFSVLIFANGDTKLNCADTQTA